MKRRTWLGIMIGSGLGAACRKPASPAPVPIWTPLTGSWTHAEGGDAIETDGLLRLSWAETLTATRWTGDLPSQNFEIEFEARRLDGSDFFAALTFPARPDAHVTWVIGGWGGSMIGISSIDDMDAAENETTTYGKFDNGVWYRFRLIRNGERIEAWLDSEKVIDVSTEGKRLSLRPGPISACLPLGFATWQSTGEIRGVRWRKL